MTSPTSGCRRRPRQRFTLIELLVVVAIISVLAAMLLPALSKARERAKTVLCADHMKQINLAMVFYMEDNDSYYPPVAANYASYTWNGQTKTNPWIPWYSTIFMGSYLGNETICSTGFSPSQQSPSTPIFYCPTARDSFKSFPGNRIWIGYNNCDWPFSRLTSNVNKNGSLSKPHKQATRAVNSTELLVLIDVKTGYAWGSTNMTKNSSWWPRHLNRANIAFLDGHLGFTYDLAASKSAGEVDFKMKD